MAHIFQDDSPRRQDKWLSFFKNTIKGSKKCYCAKKILMVSFGWFRELCLIHHVSPPIKVLA
jgi:hypothetical protein